MAYDYYLSDPKKYTLDFNKTYVNLVCLFDIRMVASAPMKLHSDATQSEFFPLAIVTADNSYLTHNL